MNRKIITILIVVIFSIGCLGLVWADNNTTDASETTEIEDTTNYIMPISITDNGIKFSDGFTGFCIDLTKHSITTDDKFTLKSPTNNENTIKLAIIECYKANKENEIESIIAKVIAKDTSNDIVEKVLSSTETIGDNANVKINNNTEATFNFELLKSEDDTKSDCLAYKVSLKKIASDDTLSAANDENLTDNESETETQDNNINTNKNISENSENASKTNDSDTTVIETNKTIVNKTNTVIVNENNTTVINQNNTKIINKTNETPQNATIQDTVMRVAGNPIFILVIVIIVIAIVAITMRRKG